MKTLTESPVKKLLEENQKLKRQLNKLSLENEMIKKALLFLAKKLDMTDIELGFIADTERQLKELLKE